MAIAIDFETHYGRDYSISTHGTWHYLRHPRFDPYLVAVEGEGLSFVGNPKDFQWEQINNRACISHNASFDQAVFERLKEQGVIDKSVAPQKWDCTADLSVYHGAPRNLAGAAKQLLGRDVEKDMRDWMKGKTFQDVQAENRVEELHDYAKRDAQTCLDLWDHCSPNWPDTERQLSAMTRKAGSKGVAVDAETVDAGIRALKRKEFEALEEIPWADEAGENPVLSLARLGEQCRKVGIEAPASLAKDSPECEAWEQKYGDQYLWVAAMRDYRRAHTLLAKLQTMKSRIRSETGVMGYGLKYFGSHTGRWSGDSGFNMQNLPRGEMFGVDLRRCLVPRPGHEFVICDLSQIEPRVLAWMTRDIRLLDQLRGGIALYEAHARATMGWKGGKLKEADPKLYGLAKARVLGLGYGCGAEKFVTVAKMMAGLTVSPREAQAIVSSFRQSNLRITAYWNKLQTDFRRSTGEDFQISLPSGRKLTYFDVSSLGGWKAKTERGGMMKTFYGGKLCENVVQAVARDVFAEALLRLEQAGINVVFHCHDEAVCEVPINSDPEEIRQLMSITPEWLPGCPLDAEAVSSNFYRK